MICHRSWHHAPAHFTEYMLEQSPIRESLIICSDVSSYYIKLKTVSVHLPALFSMQLTQAVSASIEGLYTALQ